MRVREHSSLSFRMISGTLWGLPAHPVCRQGSYRGDEAGGRCGSFL